MGSVIFLDDFRATRAKCPNCKLRARGIGHPWCGVCLTTLNLRLREHRKRRGDRCASCGYAIDPRSCVARDMHTGALYHHDCAVALSFSGVEAVDVQP